MQVRDFYPVAHFLPHQILAMHDAHHFADTNSCAKLCAFPMEAKISRNFFLDHIKGARNDLCAPLLFANRIHSTPEISLTFCRRVNIHIYFRNHSSHLLTTTINQVWHHRKESKLSLERGKKSSSKRTRLFDKNLQKTPRLSRLNFVYISGSKNLTC